MVSFPHKVIKGPHALADLFHYLDKRSSRILIIGGKTALAVTLPILEANAADHLLKASWYGGEVTFGHLCRLRQEVSEFQPDMIIAVGGGKALDMGKWVASDANLPVITVPTIAATCSAVSAVAIEYDDHGHYVDMRKFGQSPLAVVLDSTIIAHAPMRWLSAGLGDTLAKLYEFRAIASGLPTCSFNYAAYANGKLCFDIIENFADQAILDVKNGTTSEALEAVMDAIFLFAGFTSIMGVGDHVAASHALFEGFMVNDKTRDYGHGLLVGFGNLTLLVLEERPHDEVMEAIKLAKRCQIPTSLDEIASLNDVELLRIAEVAVGTGDMKNMPQSIEAAQLVDAMQTISHLSDQLSESNHQ